MKLTDLDVADGKPFASAIEAALKAIGSAELASFIEWRDPDDRRLGPAVIWSATAAGIYKVTNSGQDQHGGNPLSGELTPWTDVSGVRLLTSSSTEARNDVTIRFKISTPAFDQPARMKESGPNPLREFADECMRRLVPSLRS